MNKCKIPRIPQLLVGEKFVTCVKDKATLFNYFFVKQWQPFENASTLPKFFLRTDKELQSFDISDDEILKILSSLKTNKAHGPDDISVSMIKLCGNDLVLPLKLIFFNILRTGIFPKQWKRANATPVHKKENKQLIKNYRPISLLPIIAKVFERIIFKHLYNHLVVNDLTTKSLGLDQVILSPTNSYSLSTRYLKVLIILKILTFDRFFLICPKLLIKYGTNVLPLN